MSEFKCEVVPVVLEKHPDADSLSIVHVFDNYTCVVRTEDWENVHEGVYLPPDTVVPNTQQFAFLEGKLRIKAKRLRGVESYGMLVPIPDNIRRSVATGELVDINLTSADYYILPRVNYGDDLAELMGMRHYEPELSAEMLKAAGDAGMKPENSGSDYDIQPWQKYSNEFQEGEEVVITEKIHGTNSRYTYQCNPETGEYQMYCGSHHQWKKPGNNIYWNILTMRPWIEAFCRLNPNVILYGEIFGVVQKGYNYGSTKEHPYQFRAFDIFGNGRFLDYDSALGGAQSDFLVPVLYRGPYSIAVMEKYVNGPSTLEGADHIREGIVVKPVVERYSRRLHGRLILKYVSLDYFDEKKKTNRVSKAPTSL